MFLFPSDRASISSRHSLARRQRMVAVMAILLGVSMLFGCAGLKRQKAPTLNGDFEGSTADGRLIRLSLLHDRNTLLGIGHVGGRAFSLSGLTAYYGPFVVKWADGRVDQGQAYLAVNGASVTIGGIGETVSLNRGGPTLNDSGGIFAGSFAAGAPRQIWMVLHQDGDLLTGSGFDSGRPVALVGQLTAPLQAEGSLMFGDESRMTVRAMLSSDHRRLTIHGLGAPIEMKRR